MGAVSHLVSAAHDALRLGRPANLRVLLQKALRHFEDNSDNATLILLVKSVVSDPPQLYQMFPGVRISTQSAA